MTSHTRFFHFFITLIALCGILNTASAQLLGNQEKELFLFRFDTLLMGSAFSFNVRHSNPDSSYMAVRSAIDEVVRLERMISSWDSESETSEINANAGLRAVRVSHELYNLIRRCIKVSELSQGAFDITFYSNYKLWQFDKAEHHLPDSVAVQRAIENIGYEHIQLLPNNRVYLNDSSVQIGFGAIGKGFAANMAMARMKNYHIRGGLVNAGGDILTFGEGPQDGKWPIGVLDPINESKPLAKMSLGGMAVVTSGDYEKYFTSNGKRFSHIIDPRSGWPVSGISSVTVFCSDAELADALSTAIFVLGIEEGIQLINNLMAVECMMVDEAGNKYYSDGL